MFKVLVMVTLAFSLAALAGMAFNPPEESPYSKAFLKPESIERNANRTGFELQVDNFEGKEMVYSVMYYANGFFLGRDDFALAHGESRGLDKEFDLKQKGLQQPIRVDIQIFSQEKNYRLYYWA
jgi:hypothetical protein